MTATLLRTLSAAFLALGLSLPLAEARDIDPDRRAEIERIVREYLLAHPEVIPEAMEVLRDRMTSAMITENAQALFHTPGDPVAGNSEGDVTVVEFFDYACGYCKMMLPRLRQMLDEDPGVRLVFKDFPILSETSVTAAKAALAARRQDKYVPFHMALMGARGRLGEDRIYAIARDVGLDVTLLKQDMNRPDVAQTIADNRQLARTLGISGTPAIIVGNAMTSGAISFEDLKAEIADARAGKAKD